MGVVFQARHIFLKTSHAIKVILPDLVGNDPMLTTRFRQEALAAAAIRHQNIIAVTDFGVTRGTMPFLVMEFVKGRSLHEIMQAEGAMPVQRAWEFISAIASGVAAAHRQNIVHRDLKPLNIMVQDDVPLSEGVKILDFGLAKIKSGELLGSFVQAQTSGLMGSPFYMAPEQWGDEEPDAHADIYSLGVILYQMLAGEVPFKGSSIPSIMKKHLTMPPPSFQSMGVSVPPAIEAVVRHSLEKELDARIDTVEKFLQELRAAMDSTPAASPAVHPALRETVTVDPNRTIASTTPPVVLTSTPSVGRNEFSPATQPPISRDTNVIPSVPPAPDVGMAHESKKIQPPVEDPETTRVRSSMVSPAPSPNEVARPSVVQGRPITVDLGRGRKGPPIFLIAAVVGVLILAGIGVAAYLAFGPRTAATDDPRPTPSPIPRKAELVTINGGTFMMGRDTGPSEETPAHSVTVQPFMMDRTEVTNNEYADFVAATNRPAPTHWVNNRPVFGQEQWPVVNVSFEDAVAYARWRSKRDGVSYRLPTEQEWEYAARNGERADLYPWGSEWVPGLAVLKESTPAAVGSRPAGSNRWGVVDLIGNAWEWTSSKVSVYPGNRTVVPGDKQDLITIRGGCYVSDPANPDTPVSASLREFVPATTKNTLLGFRLVRSGS